MSAQLDKPYADDGARSVPQETLLKGNVLQALYAVRSDPQLCDRRRKDLMFWRFADLALDQAVFDEAWASIKGFRRKDDQHGPAGDREKMYVSEINRSLYDQDLSQSCY